MAQPRKNFDAAVQMYSSGLSLADIARKAGVSRQSMWEALARRGVKFRLQKRYGSDNTFHRGGRTNGKKRANLALQAATYKGIIKRPSQCEQCGASGFTEGHHDDYNKPLSVRWLCKLCHFDWHRVNKAIPFHD